MPTLTLLPQRFVLALLGAVAVLGLPAGASAELYINELFFNPGGNGSDGRDEYIELRGPANLTLENHYLIILEAENNGLTGQIENIFDLGVAADGSPAAFGSNGFLVLRQKFSRYGNPDAINPNATDLVNNGPNLPGPAFPGFGDGENSTIGASDLNSLDLSNPGEGQLEGSGFTAMLIRNDEGEAPELGDSLDADNDGLDVPTGKVGWTILDSVGFLTELELDGRLYGRVNFVTVDEFVPPEYVPNIEEGATFGLVNYEIEYLGRWGNSTGSNPEDWHVSNLTDNPGSGSGGVTNDSVDWRQSVSGNHSQDDGNPNTPAASSNPLESNQNVPYGTKLTNTLGSPNFITGDYNGNGVVDASDYAVWRETIGAGVGSESNHPAADHNHDFNVDSADFDLWIGNYGAPNGGVAAGGNGSIATTPEPQSFVLLVTLLAGFSGRLRRIG